MPRSFGLKIEDTYRTNAAQATQKNMSGNDSSLPEIGTSSQLSGVRTRTETGKPVSESGLPRSTVECQSSESPQNAGSQLHAFLVLLNSSVFGSAHYLVQTSVHNMTSIFLHGFGIHIIPTEDFLPSGSACTDIRTVNSFGWVLIRPSNWGGKITSYT